eukprot:201872-Chlamydomonas_euryale.AAC.3
MYAAAQHAGPQSTYPGCWLGCMCPGMHTCMRVCRPASLLDCEQVACMHALVYAYLCAPKHAYMHLRLLMCVQPHAFARMLSHTPVFMPHASCLMHVRAVHACAGGPCMHGLSMQAWAVHACVNCPCRHGLSMQARAVHAGTGCPCMRGLSMQARAVHACAGCPCMHGLLMHA